MIYILYQILEGDQIKRDETRRHMAGLVRFKIHTKLQSVKPEYLRSFTRLRLLGNLYQRSQQEERFFRSPQPPECL
jgi:hypothetical protein